MKQVAVFGSGNGSNFEAIIQYFKGKNIEFTCISDKEDSYILQRARRYGIKAFYIPFKNSYNFLKENKNKFDLVVLAGYMRILPSEVVSLAKMINIHPSILPAFKGINSIERAYSSGVKITGVTVHYVSEEVDAGPIIAQMPVFVKDGMSLKELEQNVHEIEHKLYPLVIDNLLFGTPYELELSCMLKAVSMPSHSAVAKS